MRIKDLEYIKDQLKPLLPDYLSKFDRQVNKNNFRCPNESYHNNGDKHPSAAFVPGTNQQEFKCFACDAKGDIFYAAHYLEGRELTGRGFTETLIHLCDTFSIHYEEDPEQQEIVRANEEGMKVARETVRVRGIVEKYMSERGLVEAIDEFELGFTGWKLIEERLADSQKKWLDKAIFEKRIIIPIHDADGELVGFAGRALSDKQRPKYTNTRENEAYKKSRILYNLHRITGDRVYVVEGYPDVWRLHLNGIPAVAICGTSLTTDHLNTLYERGIKTVTFCFDGDKAGIEASERTKKLIANDNRFKYAFKFMPYKMDPDELIHKQGIEAFKEIEEDVIQEPHERILSLMPDRVVELEYRIQQGEIEHGYEIEWQTFSRRMDGVQKGLHLVGGLSNVGKTSFMIQMFRQLAERNRDLIPIYFTIDDDWKTIYYRLLADGADITIGQARDPVRNIQKNYNMSDMAKEKALQDRKNIANKLYGMFKRAPVLDITDTKTLSDFEKTIKVLKEHTGKNVAMFVDNFHKIREEGNFRSTNERFTKVSEEIKEMTTKYDMVTFATVELRKLNHKGRPTNDDIKESVDIVYDAQAIYMLHNDFHTRQGNTPLLFTEGGKEYPIIELTVTKNKLTDFKGQIYYKFIPEKAQYKECDIQEQRYYQEKAMEKVKEDD